MPESEIRVEYSKTFEKQLLKAPDTVIEAFKKRRQLLLVNPHHPQLHNHRLRGEYQGMNSINITGDWRALYTKIGHVISFEILGTHSQLYK